MCVYGYLCKYVRVCIYKLYVLYLHIFIMCIYNTLNLYHVIAACFINILVKSQTCFINILVKVFPIMKTPCLANNFHYFNFMIIMIRCTL